MLVDSPPARFAAAFARPVVNPGSIGMPPGRAGGAGPCCATAVVAGSTDPDRQAWADEYVRAVNSDADALRAFTPD